MHMVSRRVLRVSRVVPSLVRRKTGSSGLTGTEPKSVKHLRLAFVNMAPSPLNLLLLGAVLSQSTASIISPRQRVPDGFVAKSVYPTPHGGWDRDWVDSYGRAKAIVDQMTLAEKTNITSGSGWWMAIPRRAILCDTDIEVDVVSATLAAPLALGSLNSAWVMEPLASTKLIMSPRSRLASPQAPLGTKTSSTVVRSPSGKSFAARVSTSG
ncbi:hypothetical protein EV126DRAFT_94522 [Verticillium dahliae]|nr:hypothetical protein EV126DRAFT_94522 [Verticillium dahliae]